ncbi:MAG TPA: type II toxin-antitoxin system VapC family toxin [Methylomirabilota bacterium]|nr:type II toxin-antitoxin system VapC family toxin [Methylomirabilota bacterium]
MSYLLDTNAWKAISSATKLSAQCKVLLEPETKLFLLDISFWEICKAVEYGKLPLDRSPLQWIQDSLSPNLTILAITPEIAVESCKLADDGLQTTDPADQLIVATALVHRLTLVTRDNLISKWGGVRVLNY